jgi:hypothetical protein
VSLGPDFELSRPLLLRKNKDLAAHSQISRRGDMEFGARDSTPQGLTEAMRPVLNIILPYKKENKLLTSMTNIIRLSELKLPSDCGDEEKKNGHVDLRSESQKSTSYLDVILQCNIDGGYFESISPKFNAITSLCQVESECHDT